MGMSILREQELTYVLLVELLAHQFCYPVQWINTQDVLLGEQQVERVIEIGPAATLTNITKQTIKQKYESIDSATSVQRQLLSTKANLDDIYYSYNPVDDTPVPATISRQITPAKFNPRENQTLEQSIQPPPVTTQLVPGAIDLPIDVASILQSVITIKLKKTDGVLLPPTATIKSLTGGRSTLQNEIIGDLDKEFGALPRGAEELPLDELAADIQPTFKNCLGPVSGSLISRLVSNKFPGEFGNSPARHYLENKWGLGPRSQDGVLLMAVPIQPSIRLASELDAHKFLDDVVQKYASREKIELNAAQSTQSALSLQPATFIDPKHVENIRKERYEWSKQNIQFHADDLGMDLNAGYKRSLKFEQLAAKYQKQLDIWDVEHGESYAIGIQPTFNPVKARRYQSSWNWGQQTFLRLLGDLLIGADVISGEFLKHKLRSLANRADDGLLCLMKYQQQKALATGNEHINVFLAETIKLCENSMKLAPATGVPQLTSPRVDIMVDGTICYTEIKRNITSAAAKGVFQMLAGISNRPRSHTRNVLLKEQVMIVDTEFGRSPRPLLHIQSRQAGAWHYDDDLSNIYVESIRRGVKHGLSVGKFVLLTGAGKASIGATILEHLLAGGAKVVVTTSSYTKATVDFYQQIFTRFGARGSELVVAPFNQGSRQDVDSLVDWIYDEQKGLGWDIDILIPFAAVSENGRDLDNLDSKSELAHRIMLTNALRLLGSVKSQKRGRGLDTKPTQVILPLSPNHGQLGSDGLYAESKLALESLFEKWYSEEWANYLSICGVVIGWTRGTSLMSGNDLVASGIEKFGVRTFSRAEMAFCIVAAMTSHLSDLCQQQPLMVDLSGGMSEMPHLKETMEAIRQDINRRSSETQAIMREAEADEVTLHGSEAGNDISVTAQQSLMDFGSPILPEFSELYPLHEKLRGMADLNRVVVVVGYSELGPWGSARTRWDIETKGALSSAGCTELAWIMGLIKHHHGKLNGQDYSGWIDVSTKVPIRDSEIKKRYEERILENCGIRIWEPSREDSEIDAIYHEVILQRDLAPFETDAETAEAFKQVHDDKVDIIEITSTGEFEVFFKKGAVLRIPKATSRDPKVAGLLPEGWDPRRYGIEEDIINQVDPVTLYVLVCAAEALLSAGVTDPYELYQYIHVSEIANCIGSGMGGASASKALYHQRYVDKQVQNDILQEAFINTPAAWVNMLLMSASGPIKTPVGACATSLESLESGYETIMSGKAKLCLVGGVDDIHLDTANEFANMKATVKVADELARGRTPKEMSRPTSSTRAGFVESHGCGIQVITTARLALDMGLPIRGIIALAEMASDKAGRSIPAPGVGMLSTVRQLPSPHSRPMLDISYRRRNLDLQLEHINERLEADLLYLEESLADLSEDDTPDDLPGFLETERRNLELSASLSRSSALSTYGHQFYKSLPQVSPLLGALSGWGLTIDDLTVASFHGTSTVKNDLNETHVLHTQMQHLNRTRGNPLFGVFQKHLTGHSKGAAGAWMLNGCLQILEFGFIPGNHNADDIDPSLRAFHHLTFPQHGLQLTHPTATKRGADRIEAFSVTSFGFGQKGAQAIGIHPHRLFAALPDEREYDAYKTRALRRWRKAYRRFHESFVAHDLFRAKTRPPYAEGREMEILVDLSRRAKEKDDGSYEF